MNLEYKKKYEKYKRKYDLLTLKGGSYLPKKPTSNDIKEAKKRKENT